MRKLLDNETYKVPVPISVMNAQVIPGIAQPKNRRHLQAGQDRPARMKVAHGEAFSCRVYEPRDNPAPHG